MANITKFKLGGANGDSLAVGQDGLKVFRTIIDIKKLVKEGHVIGDTIELMTLPKNAIRVAVDAVITKALTGTGSISTSLGTTIANPAEFISAETNTAVGRFTAYEAPCTATAVLASDLNIYAKFAGTTLTDGKIAVTVVAVTPTEQGKELAGYRTYPN